MELFGIDFSRLKVTGPEAASDLGGFVGETFEGSGEFFGGVGSTLGSIGSAIWTPIQYFLPKVEILDKRPEPVVGQPLVGGIPGGGAPTLQVPAALQKNPTLLLAGAAALAVGGWYLWTKG